MHEGEVVKALSPGIDSDQPCSMKCFDVSPLHKMITAAAAWDTLV